LRKVRVMSERRFEEVYKAIDERKAKTLVEVGVYRCERSKEMIKRALKHSRAEDISFFGFDLFEFMTPELSAKEVSRSSLPMSSKDALEYLTKQFPGVRINIIAGDSKKTLSEKNIPFDVAFVDGGHSYETTLSDWENISRMMKEDSVVCFDDYSEIPGVFTTQVVEEIDKSIYSVEISEVFDMSTPAYGSVKLHIAKVRKKHGQQNTVS